MQIAFLVHCEAVASDIPAVPDIGQLPVIGEITAPCGATNGQSPNLPPWHLGAVLVDDFCFIAGDRLAGTGWAVVLETVGDEDVQHLGGANPVQHGFSGLVDPVLVDRGGQGFACRHRSTQ